MGYRDVIYANYKEDLSERQVFSSFEKEGRMIEKYMKRNYLSLNYSRNNSINY